MRVHRIIILGLTLLGFALRLRYLTTTHPFFDEYTTVLAARQILQFGWPVLPSGLFYEHGLLSTYLIAPFTALFIYTPTLEWQIAQWGLMLSRWPSLILSTATIPLIYHIGQKVSIANRQLPFTLLAAGLFALSPEGMVWGGRARMYALATLLVLLTVYWAYRGSSYPAPAKYRWATILALGATLLTQFGALMLVPPLVIAMLVGGWLSQRPEAGRSWFQRLPVLLEGGALAVVIGLAILIKRLGRPLGMVSFSEAGSSSIFESLVNTVTYQTAFHFTWLDTTAFLARQFGIPHHYWLTIITLIGTLLGLFLWLQSRQLPPLQRSPEQVSNLQSPISNLFPLFLWLIFGLIILEMVTLLQPFRRNPRYIVMFLPLFYLIAAAGIANFWRLLPRRLQQTRHAPHFQMSAVLILLALLTFIGYDDLRIALHTPEPAYDEAFAFVQEEWQPGDALLTMNTPAAGLYLGRVDGFTVQADAEQFLLNQTAKPIDRWVGAPWVGTVTDFNAILNQRERVWFVIDTIRQPVYFHGDWLALLNNQMEPVWAQDNALVFRTRLDRIPLPNQPDRLVNVTLGETIQLLGYTVHPVSPQSETPAVNYNLTFFWQTLNRLPTDYTVFLHLRNSDGTTVAQQDGQPVEGAYPTSHWQPGETVIDPIRFAMPKDLPAGDYHFVVGLYHLETLERLPVVNDTSGENAVSLGAITLP